MNKLQEFKENFPTLYHGTCRSLSKTTRPLLRAHFCSAANGTKGNYVFATPLKYYAHLFAVRIPEMSIMDTFIPKKKPTPILVVENRKKYLAELEQRQNIIIELEAKDFEPMYSRHGIVTEWIRLSDLEISNDTFRQTNGLEDALKNDAQVFFVEDGTSKGEFRVEFYRSSDKKGFLLEGVKSGRIIWENQERGYDCSNVLNI